MTKTAHNLYLGVLTTIVVVVTAYLTYMGSSYYQTSMEERFYHSDHVMLKPSGVFGHGLGIMGTLLILIGVFGYMARKRFKSLARMGVLKYWLEFHIFLCVLGPIMILFHTSFKFGGIVSISFWSMVAVVASGVLGRFIYLQIPRTVQGRELSLDEIHMIREEFTDKIEAEAGAEAGNVLQAWKEITDLRKEEGIAGFFLSYYHDVILKNKFKMQLEGMSLTGKKVNTLMKFLSGELAVNRKIERLVTMQQLFRYWHIAHLPFAVIMLIIMIIHVGVTLAFGYKWIF
ncbi:MAG: hypothetical protein IPN29_17630 [Saprospiraceae bacterium]|nr:hypothetical protein [Saprospiraceae bacterium]